MNPENRDSGIDAVKILAIVLVIVHHIVEFGFSLSATAGGSLRFVWHLSRTVSITCIDLFALSTGYLCIASRGMAKRLPGLWLQAVATGMVVASLCLMGGAHVGIMDWIRTFFPVVTGEYWYFTAYFVLCLFMPFVNPGAKNLEKKAFFRLLLAFFLFLSIPSVLLQHDPFVIKCGYSFARLLVLYLFGAYWRLHVAKPPHVSVCLGVLGCCSLSFLIPSVGKRLLPGAAGEWFGAFNPVWPSSPFTLAMALAIFGLCRHVRVRSLRVRSLMAILSGLSFGMYLWLVHPVFWRAFWRPRLGAVTISSLSGFLGTLVLATGLAFAVAGLLELTRQHLFRIVAKWLSRQRHAT